MLLRIKAFFMALIIALGSISLLFRPAVPEAKSIDEIKNMSTILNPVEHADKIYVVESGRLPGEELRVAICLQGLLNKEKAQLFILGGGYYGYLDEIAKSGVELCRTDSDGNKWNLASLIREFKDSITDSGYVLYKTTYYAEGFNTACNYTTVKGWLPIPEELETVAKDCGLVLKKDISKETYNFDFLYSFFKEYKDCFNSKVIVHCKKDHYGLRDLAIQQGFLLHIPTKQMQVKTTSKKS